MAYMTGRSSSDLLGGSPGPALGQGVGLEDEVVRQEDEAETVSTSTPQARAAADERMNVQVDSVMNKLAIERRVQYGAEKMLDVRALLPF
jgi:hypothetical protein